MDRFAPYLLDRLFDNAPQLSSEGTSPMFSLKEIKDSVARDLEALLNSRCALQADTLAAYPRAARSILSFGLDDFSARSLAGASDRDFICRAILRAIEQQEPRLSKVAVSIEVRGGPARELHFSISALLRLSPLAEPVNFDAVLQSGSGHYVVSSARPPRPDSDGTAAR